MHKISLTLFLSGLLCTTTMATNDRSKDPVEIVFTYKHDKRHQTVVPTYDSHIAFNPWQYDSNQFAMSIKQNSENFQYTASDIAQVRKSVAAQLFDSALKIHLCEDYDNILVFWFKTTMNGMMTKVKFIFPKTQELTCKMCAPREEEYASAIESMLEAAPMLMAIARKTIGEMNLAKKTAAAKIDESQNLAHILANLFSKHVVIDIARKKAESSTTLDTSNNAHKNGMHTNTQTIANALSILSSDMFKSRASQKTASATSKYNESVQPTTNTITNKVIEKTPQANCSMRKLQSTHAKSGQVIKPMLTMLLLILFVCALGACNLYNLCNIFKNHARLRKYITDSANATTLPIYHYKL